MLAVYFGGCTVYAVKHGMWVCVPFLYLFVQGYAYMAALSLVPALSEMRGRHAVGESPGPAAAGG